MRKRGMYWILMAVSVIGLVAVILKANLEAPRPIVPEPATDAVAHDFDSAFHDLVTSIRGYELGLGRYPDSLLELARVGLLEVDAPVSSLPFKSRDYWPGRIIKVGDSPQAGDVLYIPARRYQLDRDQAESTFTENAAFYLFQFGDTRNSRPMSFDINLDGQEDPIRNLEANRSGKSQTGSFWDEYFEDAMVRQGYWTKDQAERHRQWRKKAWDHKLERSR